MGWNARLAMETTPGNWQCRVARTRIARPRRDGHELGRNAEGALAISPSTVYFRF